MTLTRTSIQAVDAAAAVNQMLRCEMATKTGALRWRRHVLLQAGAALLGMAAYMLAAVPVQLAEGTSSWPLAHLPSLPLQLLFFLLLGDQVCFLWLQLRALNGRLVTDWARAPTALRMSFAPQQVAGKDLSLTGASCNRNNVSALFCLSCFLVNVAILQDLWALRTLHSELRRAATLLNSAHSLQVLAHGPSVLVYK